jgi:hypothetical protein
VLVPLLLVTVVVLGVLLWREKKKKKNVNTQVEEGAGKEVADKDVEMGDKGEDMDMGEKKDMSVSVEEMEDISLADEKGTAGWGESSDDDEDEKIQGWGGGRRSRWWTPAAATGVGMGDIERGSGM